MRRHQAFANLRVPKSVASARSPVCLMIVQKPNIRANSRLALDACCPVDTHLAYVVAEFAAVQALACGVLNSWHQGWRAPRQRSGGEGAYEEDRGHHQALQARRGEGGP